MLVQIKLPPERLGGAQSTRVENLSARAAQTEGRLQERIITDNSLEKFKQINSKAFCFLVLSTVVANEPANAFQEFFVENLLMRTGRPELNSN